VYRPFYCYGWRLEILLSLIEYLNFYYLLKELTWTVLFRIKAWLDYCSCPLKFWNEGLIGLLLVPFKILKWRLDWIVAHALQIWRTVTCEASILGSLAQLILCNFMKFFSYQSSIEITPCIAYYALIRGGMNKITYF
jgi:hypothetical protein